MSTIKLPAASGGGSISIKGPSSSSSDVDLLDTSGNLKLSDDQKVKIGTGDDLQLYHNGSNSYIKNDTGWLNIPVNGGGVSIANTDFSENIARFLRNGTCELYHDGGKKFETISTGVNVTGGVRLGGNNAANELDDYEEGTWTPTMPNSGSASFATAHAFYTKIGRLVHLIAYVGFQSNASNYAVPDNSDQFRIGGIPYASTSTQYNYTAGSISYAGTGNIASWGMSPLVSDNGGNYIYFHKTDGESGTRTNANFRGALGGQEIIMSITYFA